MPSNLFGWIDLPGEVARFMADNDTPSFAQVSRVSGIQGSGAGKVVLLHEAVNKVLPSFPIHEQEIGDCVSHGFGLGVDVLKCVEIVIGNEPEEFVSETATEFLYGGGRVEVGGGQLGDNDGSLGSWQAEQIKEYGIILRKQYGIWDFTRYSGSLAKRLGRDGMPDELEPESREHPVQTVSMVTSYEEARDAISNGYSIPVCSMQGFASTRDSAGFANPSGQWAHCMLFMAVDDEYRRPGLLCMNSWGPDWIRGPKRHNQPDGSFWVDADVCTKMLRGQDSYAISQFNGYPSQDLNHLMI